MGSPVILARPHSIISVSLAVTARPIAPRVSLFAAGSPPPHEVGWVHLPELPAERGGRSVFGDGSHPTTRLCAGAVDSLCHQQKFKAVLDVGTGTGVLARIARARGAEFIVGTDVDPVALRWAYEQCALDDSAIEVVLSAQQPGFWGARFDLVVANILEGPLTMLAAQIASALVSGGILLLSGFTPIQVPALRGVYERQGLRFVQEARLGEWSLLRLER
jgi:ribosomal protein L11 methyltransferase